MKIPQSRKISGGIAISAVGFFLCAFLSGHFFYPQAFYIGHSYNLHRSEFLAFLAVIVFLQIVSRSLRTRSLLRLIEFAPLNPIGYFAMGVTALLVLSNSNVFALYQVTTYIGILLGAAALSTLTANSLAGTVTLCFGLYSFLSISQLSAYSISGIRPGNIDIAYGFANYRFFNHMQTVFIPIIVGYALSRKMGSPTHILIVLSVVLSASLLFLTAGRGSSVALLVSTCILVMLNAKQAWRYAFTLAACLFLGALVAVLINAGWSASENGIQLGIGKDLTRSSSTGRIDLWADAILKLAAQPITGIGAGNYFSAIAAAHPHNELLTLAVEYGLPVAFCIFGIVLFALIKIIRRNIGGDIHYVKLGAIGGLVAAFAHSLFSGIFMSPSGQLAVMLCLAICISRRKEAYGGSAPLAFLCRPLSSLALAVVTVVFLVTATQFVNGTFDMLSPDCKSIPKASPRIWLNADSPCFTPID